MSVKDARGGGGEYERGASPPVVGGGRGYGEIFKIWNAGECF